ncbi:MAG: Hpt domain-containing protein [Lachnospiraceae bacterium]|nr:Hpt domain-containing protein [Lachnospiraceae bacterium]
MNQEIKEQMREAGVNIEGALERLMNNEGLYERLLGKFKADKNYQGLVDAIGEKRYEDAFNCAHALKGVAGNLGLDSLMEADVVIVEKLRANTTDGLDEDVKALTETYDNIMRAIETLG